ncbi:MAG: ATP-dependent Clp protease ATP-binding subunit, partial [Oscillospiraceae bacterium]
MKLCAKCKKRPAIVFVQRMEGGETKNEGYCISCAQEMGIAPVDEMLKDMKKQFGLSEKDLENMQDHFADYFGETGVENLQNIANAEAQAEGQEAEEATEDFEPGGSATFPFPFGNKKKNEEEPPKTNGRGNKGGKRKFLDAYCENLTKKAADGKLDRVVGRDREIYRTLQILSRRQKINPCLIGEAGVGKTAIA